MWLKNRRMLCEITGKSRNKSKNSPILELILAPLLELIMRKALLASTQRNRRERETF
jgi:hypothetical protein